MIGFLTPCRLRMGVPGRHPFCNRHDRSFSGCSCPLSDWECRYAQVCASKAPQASRPSRTPQGRVGTKCRPCRSQSPLFRGMACLYIHSAASLSFAPAEKETRHQHQPPPLHGAACRLPLPGETGRNPVRDSPRPFPMPQERARKRNAGTCRQPCGRRGTTFPKLP